MREINGKQTIPLSGWRTRELALVVFGNKAAEVKFVEGLQITVDAQVIRNLPDFDKANQAHADSFSGPVLVTVEQMATDYGSHISLEPFNVALVRKVAMEHYEEGGDSIIECWSDADTQEWIDGTGDWANLGKGTMTELLGMFELLDGVRKDIQGA